MFAHDLNDRLYFRLDRPFGLRGGASDATNSVRFGLIYFFHKRSVQLVSSKTAPSLR